MRILLMADTPANPDSGAAGTEFQTVAALRNLGHQVDTVWADELPHRIRHGNLHYLFELPLAYPKQVSDRLRSQHYDVVHINQPHGYLAARLVKKLDGNRPVFVHRSHGLEARARAVLAPWQHRFPIPRPLMRRAASHVMEALLEFNNRGITRYADGHIVSATLCADYLHRQCSVARSRIAVIPQAAPGCFLEASCHDLKEERLDRILHVGQYAFVKAPMILAQAFAEILRQRPNAALTWVCAARHHREAASLFGPRERERIRFLDWMPQPQLMQVYDEHGVFLFPSFFEGFGKAFVEAMARGLVVVASAEGGARDLIEHGRNGLLVAPGDSTALAATCVSVQSNPELAREITTRARATALGCTWHRVAEETADFYRRLIDAR